MLIHTAAAALSSSPRFPFGEIRSGFVGALQKFQQRGAG